MRYILSKRAGNACVTDGKRWWLTPVENFVFLEKQSLSMTGVRSIFT